MPTPKGRKSKCYLQKCRHGRLSDARAPPNSTSDLNAKVGRLPITLSISKISGLIVRPIWHARIQNLQFGRGQRACCLLPHKSEDFLCRDWANLLDQFAWRSQTHSLVAKRRSLPGVACRAKTGDTFGPTRRAAWSRARNHSVTRRHSRGMVYPGDAAIGDPRKHEGAGKAGCFAHP